MEDQQENSNKKMGLGEKIAIGIVIILAVIVILGNSDNESDTQGDSKNTSEIKGTTVTDKGLFYTNTDTGASYEIVNKYYFLYGDSSDLIMDAFVVITNTGKTDLYLTSSHFDIEDQNGKLIKSEDRISSFPQFICPNEEGIFYERIYLDSADPNEKYNIVPSLNVELAKSDFVRLPISELQIKEDEDGWGVKVLGRIENNTTDEYSLLYANVMLLDKNGAVISVVTKYCDSIQPGQKLGFEAFVDTYIELEDIDSYIAFAEPYQYNW